MDYVSWRGIVAEHELQQRTLVQNALVYHYHLEAMKQQMQQHTNAPHAPSSEEEEDRCTCRVGRGEFRAPGSSSRGGRDWGLGWGGLSYFTVLLTNLGAHDKDKLERTTLRYGDPRGRSGRGASAGTLRA